MKVVPCDPPGQRGTIVTCRPRPNATLDNFRLDHLDIEAKTAGFIANARNWEFADNEIKTADGSKVSLTNAADTHVTDVPYGEHK